MKKIFYNYYLPFRNLFKYETEIEKYIYWKDFKKAIDKNEPTIIILPVGIFDLVGLDIRFQFREIGRNDNLRFLLVGTAKQIEYSLSQNEKFLGNLIDQVVLPLDADVIELAVLKKINNLEKLKKGNQ